MSDTAEAKQDDSEQHAEVLVLGAGPGGYTAAFRAADLGKQVTLVERYPALGGVCLNVGCIPSKALLHVAGTITAAQALGAYGVVFDKPQIDPARLNTWKDSVVQRLADGLAQLARRRNVKIVQGTARFASAHHVLLDTQNGPGRIRFDHAIIAAGSHPVWLPNLPDDPRIMDSTAALRLESIPRRLLVVGGGIIGLEMATVFDALGSEITIVEKSSRLMPGADADLVRVLKKRIESRYAGIHLDTGISAIEAREDGLKVRFEGNPPAHEVFDRVLVAIGRRPNTATLAVDTANIEVDTKGFIKIDHQMRTNMHHIFAIGDIVGEPQLAHKATHQGKIAAEVIAGKPSAFDARAIPAVAYTDPEIAWMGITEEEASARQMDVEVARFPWSASGRALGMARSDGMTKLIFDKNKKLIVGAGVVGLHAGDLIAETVLALEMGADAADIGLTIHPHPTLSETVAFAAEIAEDTITELYAPGRRP